MNKASSAEHTLKDQQKEKLQVQKELLQVQKELLQVQKEQLLETKKVTSNLELSKPPNKASLPQQSAASVSKVVVEQPKQTRADIEAQLRKKEKVNVLFAFTQDCFSYKTALIDTFALNSDFYINIGVKFDYFNLPATETGSQKRKKQLESIKGNWEKKTPKEFIGTLTIYVAKMDTSRIEGQFEVDLLDLFQPNVLVLAIRQTNTPDKLPSTLDSSAIALSGYFCAEGRKSVLLQSVGPLQFQQSQQTLYGDHSLNTDNKKLFQDIAKDFGDYLIQLKADKLFSAQ